MVENILFALIHRRENPLLKFFIKIRTQFILRIFLIFDHCGKKNTRREPFSSWTLLKFFLRCHYRSSRAVMYRFPVWQTDGFAGLRVPHRPTNALSFPRRYRHTPAPTGAARRTAAWPPPAYRLPEMGQGIYGAGLYQIGGVLRQGKQCVLRVGVGKPAEQVCQPDAARRVAASGQPVDILHVFGVILKGEVFFQLIDHHFALP